jgi:hypothetical protein
MIPGLLRRFAPRNDDSIDTQPALAGCAIGSGVMAELDLDKPGHDGRGGRSRHLAKTGLARGAIAVTRINPWRRQAACRGSCLFEVSKSLDTISLLKQNIVIFI